jgi:type IV pilus assembly protein PilM
LTAAALLAVALLPPIVSNRALAESLGARGAKLNAELQPVRVIAKRNAANLERLKYLREQIAALQRLVDAKASWVAFLGDLQERLEAIEDVWLDHLAILRIPAAADGKGSRAAKAQIQLRLSGRLLDADHPASKVSAESYARVRALLGSIRNSPFIASLQDEKFDNTQPGMLRFEVTLAIDRTHTL